VLGADLDSLADIISFGVAPAVLGYTLGLRGGWDMLCLTYFVVCGVSRLARFNVTAEALAIKRPKVSFLRARHRDEHGSAILRRPSPGPNRDVPGRGRFVGLLSSTPSLIRGQRDRDD
jgi:hypothetical protein